MLKVVEKGALREASWDLFKLDEIALAGARDADGGAEDGSR